METILSQFLEVFISTPESVVARSQERKAFLFITIFLFPLLSIVLVGGYGLMIWLSQILLGPPTV